MKISYIVKKIFCTAKKNNLYKTIDYREGLKTNETLYNIDDNFINYIIGNKLTKNINSNDNYVIQFL